MCQQRNGFGYVEELPQYPALIFVGPIPAGKAPALWNLLAHPFIIDLPSQIHLHGEMAMPNTPDDKIFFGIGQGATRSMVRLADGTYADRTAPAVGAGLATDSTGQVMFDLSSLPCKLTYDANGNQISITYGPDQQGRFVRQTSTWANGLLMAESAWVMVASADAP